MRTHPTATAIKDSCDTCSGKKNIFFRFILLHTCGTKGNKMEYPLIVCDDKEIKNIMVRSEVQGLYEA